jgi:RNA polymerase-binding transcription factor DksA
MNKKDIEYFKKRLEKEKTLVEEEVKTVGSSDPNNPKDFSATSNDMDIDRADENELSDKMEELEDNKGILDSLEKQLKDINSALEKIAGGTYGICEISGEPIERERLEANPAARTCMKHVKERGKEEK